MSNSSLVSKDYFSVLLKGAGINLLAKSLAVMLGFIASVLIARHYGSDTVGVLATITSFFSLIATCGLLGSDTLVLKETSKLKDEGGWNKVWLYYLKILRLVLTGCLLICFLLYILGVIQQLDFGGISNTLPLFLVVVAACIILNANFLRATGDYLIFSLLDFLPAFLMLLLVIVAISTSTQEGKFQYLYFAGNVGVCLMSFYLVRRKIYHNRNVEKQAQHLPSYKDTLKVSLPMLGVTMSAMIIQHLDVLLIGYYMQKTDVGIYSVYLKISSLVSFATVSISAMFSPTVAKLYREGDHKQLRIFAKKTTAITSLCAFVIGALLILLHRIILSLYTEEFLSEVTSLYILILVPMAHSFFGITGFFLNMTGSQNKFLLIILFGAVLNIIGNIILIPRFGLQGAAIASLISVVAWNTASAILIKTKHGHTLFFFGRRDLIDEKA